MAYGYQVAGNDDQMVRVIEEGFRVAASLAVPGKFWVENLPFCSSKIFVLFAKKYTCY